MVGREDNTRTNNMILNIFSRKNEEKIDVYIWLKMLLFITKMNHDIENKKQSAIFEENWSK
jgi:hypothetical protein